MSGLATSRAHSKKSCAIGLSVRFFKVKIPTGPGRIGNFTGKILSDIRLALNRSKEPGRTHKNRPLASRALCNEIEKVTALMRGGGKRRL